jgi:hypothetical protein
MNNFRLTTNNLYHGKLVIENSHIDSVFSLPAPYDIYGSLRTKAGTYTLISRPKITVKDSKGIYSNFDSISLLAKEFSLDTKDIVKALLFNKTLNGLSFTVNYNY